MYRFAVAALALSAVQALAQAQGACERKPDAPEWVPCGPDRVLSAEDLKQYLFKDNLITKMQIKGGSSGRMFFTDFHPDGKMPGGPLGGADIGKNWTMEGNKVCRNFYQIVRGPQCGPFELKDGVLYLVEPDGQRNPVTDIRFVPK